MYCPRCKFEYSDENRICTECGCELVEVLETDEIVAIEPHKKELSVFMKIVYFFGGLFGGISIILLGIVIPTFFYGGIYIGSFVDFFLFIAFKEKNKLLAFGFLVSAMLPMVLILIIYASCLGLILR